MAGRRIGSARTAAFTAWAVFGCVLMSMFAAPDRLAAKDTTLLVTVFDEDGEPVSRASVIIRRMKGKKLKGDALQLKTSQRGTAPLPPIKRGVYALQVISDGFQTYGGKIELTEPEQTVTITLKPPQKQHSVHAPKK